MEFLIALLMFTGAALMAIAGIGLIRLPDFYLRMAATTKATILGAALMLVAAALFFGDTAVTARVVAIVLLFFIMSPIGAHMIGRAAYKDGVPLWDKTVTDQWEGRIPRVEGSVPDEEVPLQRKRTIRRVVKQQSRRGPAKSGRSRR